MKKAKKVVALVLCAVLLVVGSVAGTMAYLTDKEEVLNTFTVGNVDIKLDEYVVNEYGTIKDGSRTEDGNTYKLMPGHEYTKDPRVTVLKGSEPSYVRILVSITDITDVKAVFGEDFLPQNFVEGWDSTTWLTTGVVSVKDNAATYEFRYASEVDARETDVVLDALFDKIVIPGEGVDGADLDKIKEMQINVVAQAIQADGFAAKDGKTAVDVAWDAFNKQMNPVTE